MTLTSAPSAKQRYRHREIDIERIFPDENQPREEFPDEYLQRLAESIREKGLKVPIRVHLSGCPTCYVILAGECRWRACLLAGLTSIPCYVYDSKLNKLDVLEEQIIEEDLRLPWNDIERAKAYLRLMTARRWNVTVFCRQLNLNRSTVERALSVLKIPSDLQEKVGKRKPFSLGIAQEVSKLADPDTQRQVAATIIDNNLPHRTAAAVVRNVQGSPRPEPPGPTREEFAVLVPKQSKGGGKDEATVRVVVTSPAKVGPAGVKTALEKARAQKELTNPGIPPSLPTVEHRAVSRDKPSGSTGIPAESVSSSVPKKRATSKAPSTQIAKKGAATLRLLHEVLLPFLAEADREPKTVFGQALSNAVDEFPPLIIERLLRLKSDKNPDVRNRAAALFNKLPGSVRKAIQHLEPGIKDS